jgi:hypothetical protein
MLITVEHNQAAMYFCAWSIRLLAEVLTYQSLGSMITYLDQPINLCLLANQFPVFSYQLPKSYDGYSPLQILQQSITTGRTDFSNLSFAESIFIIRQGAQL